LSGVNGGGVSRVPVRKDGRGGSKGLFNHQTVRGLPSVEHTTYQTAGQRNCFLLARQGEQEKSNENYGGSSNPKHNLTKKFPQHPRKKGHAFQGVKGWQNEKSRTDLVTNQGESLNCKKYAALNIQPVSPRETTSQRGEQKN